MLCDRLADVEYSWKEMQRPLSAPIPVMACNAGTEGLTTAPAKMI
jgi:hypothetical protein